MQKIYITCSRRCNRGAVRDARGTAGVVLGRAENVTVTCNMCIRQVLKPEEQQVHKAADLTDTAMPAGQWHQMKERNRGASEVIHMYSKL